MLSPAYDSCIALVCADLCTGSLNLQCENTATSRSKFGEINTVPHNSKTLNPFSTLKYWSSGCNSCEKSGFVNGILTSRSCTVFTPTYIRYAAGSQQNKAKNRLNFWQIGRAHV